MAKSWARKVQSKKQSALIIYASVTGNAAKYASELGDYLTMGFNSEFMDACCASSIDETKVVRSINSAELIILITSTQGNGDIPSTSKKFFSFLFGKCANALADKECAVLGEIIFVYSFNSKKYRTTHIVDCYNTMSVNRVRKFR